MFILLVKIIFISSSLHLDPMFECSCHLDSPWELFPRPTSCQQGRVWFCLFLCHFVQHLQNLFFATRAGLGFDCSFVMLTMVSDWSFGFPKPSSRHQGRVWFHLFFCLSKSNLSCNQGRVWFCLFFCHFDFGFSKLSFRYQGRVRFSLFLCHFGIDSNVQIPIGVTRAGFTFHFCCCAILFKISNIQLKKKTALWFLLATITLTLQNNETLGSCLTPVCAQAVCDWQCKANGAINQDISNNTGFRHRLLIYHGRRKVYSCSS